MGTLGHSVHFMGPSSVRGTFTESTFSSITLWNPRTENGISARDPFAREIPIHQPLPDHPGNNGLHLVQRITFTDTVATGKFVDVTLQMLGAILW